MKAVEKFETKLEESLWKNGLLSNRSRRFKRRLYAPAAELLEERRNILMKREEQRTLEERKRLNEINEYLRYNSKMAIWSKVYELCKSLSHKDFKRMFEVIKQCINDIPAPAMKGISPDRDSPAVEDHEGCMKILRAYLLDMFKKTDFVPPEEVQVSKKFFDNSFDHPITMEELKECIKNSKKVAYGYDCIPIELFKGVLESPTIMNLLLFICNLIFKGYITDRMNTSVVKMIPKKNDSTYVGDMRPIAISTTLPKLVSSIINNRLLKECSKQEVVTVEQAGFLPNEETMGQVLFLLHEGWFEYD